MSFKYIYFPILVFSYYLIAPINFLLQSEGPLVSLGLRMLIFFVGILVILNNKLTKISITSLFLLFLLILINLLLFSNLYVLEYPTNDSKDGFYLFHLLIVIPTCLLVALFKYNETDSIKVLITTAKFFLLASILNTACGLIELASNPLVLLSGRFQHSYLNPISMGFLFASGLITWLLVSLFERKLTLTYFIIMLFMFAGVIGSNSRSALIGTVLAILYICVYEVIRNKNFKLIFIVSITSIVGLMFSISYLNINPLGRIASITSKTETSVTTRVEVWNDSLNIIADSPLFPGRLVTNFGGFPHNLVVELTTGFGVPIAFFILLLLLSPLMKVPKSKTLVIYASLYILYFMRATTSGGLFQLSELFALAIIIFCIYKLRFFNGVNSRNRPSA